jgi:hypothetical protein
MHNNYGYTEHFGFGGLLLLWWVCYSLYCLQDTCEGDILLQICYHSRKDVVEVLILEVSNLKRHDVLRLPSKTYWVLKSCG